MYILLTKLFIIIITLTHVNTKIIITGSEKVCDNLLRPSSTSEDDCAQPENNDLVPTRLLSNKQKKLDIKAQLIYTFGLTVYLLESSTYM